MTSDEAKAARLALKMSQHELAATCDLTEPVVAAWEDGRIKVPRAVEVELRWRVAREERVQALATSGLAECPWVVAFDAEPVPEKMEAQTARIEKFVAHVDTCETCKAREAYVEERFGPMPPAPRPRGWLGIVMMIAEQVQRLPAWAQPAATGAVIFMVLSLGRIIIYLPAILRSPGTGLLEAAAAFGISAGFGAVLGFLFGLFQQMRKRWAARSTT